MRRRGVSPGVGLRLEASALVGDGVERFAFSRPSQSNLALHFTRWGLSISVIFNCGTS